MPQKQRRPVESAGARNDARVTFVDGSVYSAPLGTSLEDFFVAAQRTLIPPARQPGDSDEHTAAAAVCNKELRELTYPVLGDMHVRPVTMSEGDGMRIYRRSLAFALRVAAYELFPEIKLTVDHALPFGSRPNVELPPRVKKRFCFNARPLEYAIIEYGQQRGRSDRPRPYRS